jgi:hypothetical protein
MKLFKVLLILWVLSSEFANAQVSIISGPISPYVLSNAALCSFSAENYSSEEIRVIYTIEITDRSNERIIWLESSPFYLLSGINNVSGDKIFVTKRILGTGKISESLKRTSMLDFGNYQYCISIQGVDNGEIFDKLCEEFTSEFTDELFLVSPFDKDTIYSTNPLLIWGNGSNAIVNDASNRYRLTLVELEGRIDPIVSLQSGQPLFVLDYVPAFAISYPATANKLSEGKSYAWKIQRYYDSKLLSESEIWTFTISKFQPPFENKYALVTSSPGIGYYIVNGYNLYFRFDESYSSTGDLKYQIFDERGKHYELDLSKERSDTSHTNSSLKSAGTNLYQLSLEGYELHNGKYQLVLENEKGERYYLKFVIQE